jgi:hypothetical protein
MNPRSGGWLFQLPVEFKRMGFDVTAPGIHGPNYSEYPFDERYLTLKRKFSQ